MCSTVTSMMMVVGLRTLILGKLYTTPQGIYCGITFLPDWYQRAKDGWRGILIICIWYCHLIRKMVDGTSKEKSIEEIPLTIDGSMRSVSRWLGRNPLRLKMSKTQFISFGGFGDPGVCLLLLILSRLHSFNPCGIRDRSIELLFIAKSLWVPAKYLLQRI